MLSKTRKDTKLIFCEAKAAFICVHVHENQTRNRLDGRQNKMVEIELVRRLAAHVLQATSYKYTLYKRINFTTDVKQLQNAKVFKRLYAVVRCCTQFTKPHRYCRLSAMKL
jgi:tRNA A37 N6-isopentenylltransferase MiaA